MVKSKKIWYAPNKMEAYGQAEIDAVVACLQDGWLAGFGPKTLEFESKIAAEFGKKHALFVNSGSSAILLGLAALDLPRDSEVVTPACTFATTLAPILQCGLEPVFVDVQMGRYVPSVDAVVAAIGPKTRVVLLPNLIGSKPDWSELRRRLESRPDICLFEDSADTITHTPETDVATTSFYASHLITAGGIGGMVMFNDEGQLKRACMYRDWGRIGDNSESVDDRFASNIDGIPYDYKFLYGVVGYNLKCGEMNAAFGLAQLARLPQIKATRRALFERYLRNLAPIAHLISLPDNTVPHDWMAIPFCVPNRLALLTWLESNNIQTRVCFAGNVTRHPAYRKYCRDMPVADRIMAEGFLLGCHHGMSEADVDHVCAKIIEFFFH